MGGGVKTVKPRVHEYARAMTSFVRPPLRQSPDFLALQKISFTPAQLKPFNMLQFMQY